MKASNRTNVIVLLSLLGSVSWALAQGTAFTYQGLLLSGGVPYSGYAEFQPTLWDSVSGGSLVASNRPPQLAVIVSNGLFVLPLDFGNNFPGADRWLQLEVRTALSPFTTLSPRQQLTPTPYAMTALTASNLTGTLPATQLSGAIPSANLSGTYSSAVTFNNPANNFSGNGAGLTSLNASQLASGTVPDARLGSNVARTNQVWLLSGNAGTTAGTHFLGTTDNQPLELRVNRLRALRLEDNGDGSDSGSVPDGAPNVIGGSPANFVGAGVVGATIAGGGATNMSGSVSPNSILADYAFIGGGANNAIGTNAGYSSIGGGTGNRIRADSSDATIAGGLQNAIGTNAGYSFIGGGSRNDIEPKSSHATIAGGMENVIGTNADWSFIGGGDQNGIGTDSWHATIAGGYHNAIRTNADESFIGGGRGNAIGANSYDATIAGGYVNNIGTEGYCSFIGGGGGNGIGADSWYATIAGGYHNAIGTNADDSFIGGGYDNAIEADSAGATIAGGYNNAIGTNADYSFIGGGERNGIGADSSYATIVGGRNNAIDTNADYSFIGGGYYNAIGANSRFATIAGGIFNGIGTNADESFIGGGSYNGIGADSSYATIAGGYWNAIGTKASGSFIGGGLDNEIGADSPGATIAGGWNNAIGTNAYNSFIGGGSYNAIGSNSWYATIPGGWNNYATNYAFAAGYRAKAKHTGAFVWGDYTDADIASTNANSVTMRASGGYRLFSDAGATIGVRLAPGSGSWSSMCDRNAKENFAAVDPLDVLQKVVALPVQTWNYKSQDASIRHIGPTAQDFKAAFGVGESDTGITGIDADGVALAAIQGLNERVENEKRKAEKQISQLMAENAALKRELGELKKLVYQLAAQLDGGRQ